MNSVWKKILEARATFGEIKKDVKGYDYKYSDLEGMMDAIGPSLADKGVGITWDFALVYEGKWLQCDCIAMDDTSQMKMSIFLPTFVVEKARNATQEMGKLYTYARRYSLSALLNLVSEQDTDAATPKVDLSQVVAPRPPPAKPSPTPDATKYDW